jgi:hypothetical protein
MMIVGDNTQNVYRVSSETIFSLRALLKSSNPSNRAAFSLSNIPFSSVVNSLEKFLPALYLTRKKE